MTLSASGEAIEAEKSYVVTGWASVNEGTEGPPIYEVVTDYVKSQSTLKAEPSGGVEIVGWKHRVRVGDQNTG